MDKNNTIRPVVLGIAKKDNKILVGKGYDVVKKHTFYRCPGGGIEFLETSVEALKREYKEEFDIDIIVEDYIGMVENIFKFDGKNGHEIDIMYNIKIKDEDIKEEYTILDSEGNNVYWVDIEDFKNREKILYPEGLIDKL